MKLFLKNANKKLWRKHCEENLTEKNLCDFLKSMQNDRSPGNDG